jgi:hypothetical protein
MNEAIFNLTHAAKKSFGLSVAVLLTMLTADKAQATDKGILAIGNDIENAFWEMPSAGRNFDITTSGEFYASSPTEANNPTGGDPAYLALINVLISRPLENDSQEALKGKLTDARTLLESVPEIDEKSQLRLLKFISKIKNIIKMKEPLWADEQELAKLKAKNAALDKENAALVKEIVKIKAEQEATKNHINETKQKLKIIQTNSNPQ